jgi:hypothetical protein
LIRLSDIAFLTLWMLVAGIMTYGAYYDKSWMRFFSRPSMEWRIQRQGKETVHNVNLILGILMLIAGFIIALEMLWSTPAGEICISAGVLSIVFLVLYAKRHTLHARNGTDGSSPSGGSS